MCQLIRYLVQTEVSSILEIGMGNCQRIRRIAKIVQSPEEVDKIRIHHQTLLTIIMTMIMIDGFMMTMMNIIAHILIGANLIDGTMTRIMFMTANSHQSIKDQGHQKVERMTIDVKVWIILKTLRIVTDLVLEMMLGDQMIMGTTGEE